MSGVLESGYFVRANGVCVPELDREIIGIPVPKLPSLIRLKRFQLLRDARGNGRDRFGYEPLLNRTWPGRLVTDWSAFGGSRLVSDPLECPGGDQAYD